MKTGTKLLASTMVGAIASMSQAAVVIDFDTDADYDSNFHEVANGGVVSRVASGYLEQFNNSDVASGIIYNANATGGSGGAGGTGSGLPLDKFGGTSVSGGFAVQADSSVSAYDNASSIGFYTKVNDARTSGYAAVFRILSGGFDFRVFNDNASPSGAAVGTQIASQSYSLGGAPGTNAFYRFKLDVIDVGSNVEFSGSVWTTSGSLIHTFTTVTDSSSAATGAGQVGLRIGSNINDTVRVDNFAITVVPEPASLALLGLAGMSMLRRRR